MRLRKAACSCLLLVPSLLLAAPKTPADYPLRVHIFSRSETTFYEHRQIDESRGEGRANLFADGDVHAVDFSFSCSQKLKSSFGFEAYPARWKKPGRELEVLLPVFGKTGSYWTCDLKTDVRDDIAYFFHDGRMGSEPVQKFKDWMVRHNYDPEHGKDVPTTDSANADAGSKPAAQ